MISTSSCSVQDERSPSIFGIFAFRCVWETSYSFWEKSFQLSTSYGRKKWPDLAYVGKSGDPENPHQSGLTDSTEIHPGEIWSVFWELHMYVPFYEWKRNWLTLENFPEILFSYIRVSSNWDEGRSRYETTANQNIYPQISDGLNRWNQSSQTWYSWSNIWLWKKYWLVKRQDFTQPGRFWNFKTCYLNTVNN